MNKAVSGFTLIELVTVVTILGILAAFALPRFAALEVEAREAATDGLAGSVRAAASLAHGLWLSQDGPATVTMEGQVITMVNGYPNLASIDDALMDFTGFSYAPLTGVFDTTGAPGVCTITYAEAGVGGSPTITVNKTAC